MGIAKALTADLERAIKLYRVPIVSALAMSLRNALEDRFLLTDARKEDVRRNVFPLSGILNLERQMTKLDVGIDSRQFIDMGGLMLFDGILGADGLAIPGPNVSASGGRADADDVNFTATGTAAEKAAKLQRYTLRKPEQINWRVRTPVMMADATAVVDYLAFRISQLQFLHSIAIKWSDRRWDGRTAPISADLYRPAGENSDMVVLAPVWMDQTMSILDPNIWGPYESLLRANYEEYLGRHHDEYQQDLLAFTDIFQDYEVVLQPGMVCSSQAETNWQTIGRLTRKLSTTHNRTLHIPFDRSIDTRTDSYHPKVSDPTGATDVTGDIFNMEDADGNWLMTSSFEAASLAVDGWYGANTSATQSTDIPTGLPAYTTDRNGTAVVGTKSLDLTNGFVARRMILPDGRFILHFWVKNVSGDARIEIVRNTRLRPKQITMNIPTSRVTSITHFRESYETVQAATLRNVSGWRQLFISFELKDHFFVASEGYPAHEVFIVLSTVDGSAGTPEVKFDHLALQLDDQSHDIKILNTATRSVFPDLLLPNQLVVDLEKAFGPDTEYHSRERAGSFFRFDGANTCCVAKHRNGYNLHPSGTNINAWWKVNSQDETNHNVLNSRNSFILFNKGSAYLPSYNASINFNHELAIGWAGSGASSTGFYNHMLHPSITDGTVPAVTNWASPSVQYTRYTQALVGGGQQPREWTNAGNTTLVSLPAALTGVAIGNGKTLVISGSDPYLTTGRTEMADPADGTHVTLWMYLEWHARNAYRLTMPEAQVVKNTNFSAFSATIATGNVFLTIPVNTDLLVIPQSLGSYSPSPHAWSPHVGAHGSPLRWPISPCDWGGTPDISDWPAQYGTPPVWHPYTLGSVVDVNALLGLTPMFLNGRLTFDRWFNLDLNVDSTGSEIRINGVLLALAGGGTFNVVNGKENSDDLQIATTNPNDSNTCSPVSCWSFKIAQTKLSQLDISNLVQSEAINLNELQYGIWGAYLDFDGDRQFDWYQESLTDFGLEMTWVTAPTSPAVGAFPSSISTLYGKVAVSAADPILISPQVDRNRDVIEDHFDEIYLKELIDAQTMGFTDGLIFWDFLTDQNDAYHSFTDRVYDPNCQAYKTVNLEYRPWVNSLITTEFNSVQAITDPIPTLTGLEPTPPYGPSSPQPAFGTQDNQLLMTGVKGWFGFNDLLGYRDSLAKLATESMIFDYIQIEFRFRADRSVLQNHLKHYARSYQQLFTGDFPGNQLKPLTAT